MIRKTVSFIVYTMCYDYVDVLSQPSATTLAVHPPLSAVSQPSTACW